MNEGLTIKQENFARAYVRLGDKSAAYREAYNAENMKDETVNRKAFDVFNNGNVRARISQLQDEAGERHDITVDKLIKEWAKLAFTDLPDVLDFAGGAMTLTDFKNLSPAQRACIKKFKAKTEVALKYDDHGNPTPTPVDLVEVEFYDKQVALLNLGKHIGFYEKDNFQKKQTSHIIMNVDPLSNDDYKNPGGG